MSPTNVIRLSPAILTDFDGIGIDELAAAYVAAGWPEEKAIDQALGDVLIDLSRRTEAARAS